MVRQSIVVYLVTWPPCLGRGWWRWSREPGGGCWSGPWRRWPCYKDKHIMINWYFEPVCSREAKTAKTRAESCGPWFSSWVSIILRLHLTLSRSSPLSLLERPWRRYPWFCVGSFPPSRNRAWGRRWELHQKLSGKRFMVCTTFCI